VRAPLDDFAVIEHDDFVAIAYGAKTVGYHDACAAAVADILDNDLFSFSI
jgi:hypothetical protein